MEVGTKEGRKATGYLRKRNQRRNGNAKMDLRKMPLYLSIKPNLIRSTVRKARKKQEI